MAPVLQQIIRAGFAVVSYLSIGAKWTPSNPSIALSLTPVYGCHGPNITALSAAMQFDHVSYKKDALLVQISLMSANVPNNRYDGDALQAFDQQGPLPLYIKDSNSAQANHNDRGSISILTEDVDLRSWYTTRDTSGPITFSFTALPRIVLNTTMPGPRFDLRTDGGGIVGSGINFLPLPLASDTLYDLRLDWNLSSSPKGTTAAWSFGDGISTSLSATADYLSMTVYAVGPLKKYTETIVMDDGTTKDYGFYWFGEPRLFNATQLAVTVRNLFVGMAPFFDDEGDSYRVFVRYNPVHGYGGTGQLRSFVLEYDSHIQVSEDFNVNLLAHEMVHNWPLLEGWDDMDNEEGSWYTEGVADYYSLILLWRFNIWDDKTFLLYINKEAGAYYGNPALSMTNDESARKAWISFGAQTLPYKRGSMYLLDLNAKIRAANNSRSVDDLVLDMLHRRYDGRPYGKDVWIDLIKKELGSKAVQDFEAMADGKLIVPSSDSLGPKFELVREDREPLEVGYDERSFSTLVIEGLVAGSRAEEAGLRNGDIVIEKGFLFQVAECYHCNFTLVISRNGKERDISYWPRKRDKVECWQWIASNSTD